MGQHKWADVLRKLGISRGNPGWFDAFKPSMTGRGQELGVEMDFGGDVGNSMDSLRLLAWAGATSPLQEPLARHLAHGQFTRKECVGDLDVLVRAADAVGLDKAEARRVLSAKDEYADAVMRGIAWASNQGFHSIPVFLFAADGARPIEAGGARGVDEYAAILRGIPRSATGLSA